jgi:CPA2 family monovalent cation:H+ antiporter-2
MDEAHAFLSALTIVLSIAGATTLLFQRLGQPVVLGYLLAGLIVGPYVPIPLVADAKIVHALAELGVILLMFCIGLELRLGAVVKMAPNAGLTALVQSSAMVWVGFLVGKAFGWTTFEALFVGAMVAISSTTIVVKAFDESKISGRLRDLVLGVLVVEDLIAVLLIALLTTVASPAGFQVSALLLAGGRLGVFLIGLSAVGLLVVPRTIRAAHRLDRPETLLVVSVGICFLAALLAQYFGYSVALGAFIAGSLVAESGVEKEVEHVVAPVRDVFGAIFFVAVGMLIDPAVVVREWGAIAALTGVVIVGKIISVTVSAFLTGNGTQTAVRAGMSLAQIGEFSFIIAGLGLSLKVTGDFLYPIAVSVAALTTLTTPWLIRASEAAAVRLDRVLPHRFQTFASLYTGWIEGLRSAATSGTTGASLRRWGLLLAGDAVLPGGVLVGASVEREFGLTVLHEHLGLAPRAAAWAYTAGALTLAAPLVFGILRVSAALGARLAEAALGQAEASAARQAAQRALRIAAQLVIVLLVCLPVLAITQPMTGGVEGGILVGALIAVVLWSLIRSAAALEGEVKAGSQLMLKALADRVGAGPGDDHDLRAKLRSLVPGLVEPVPIRIRPEARAVGRSLGELDLRGRTGATVLAILRADGRSLLPSAREPLCAGDVLALTGGEHAVEAARAVLDEP